MRILLGDYNRVRLLDSSMLTCKKYLKTTGFITRNYFSDSLKKPEHPFVTENQSMWAFTFIGYTQLNLQIESSISNSPIQSPLIKTVHFLD